MERLGRCQQESDKLRCECLVIMITQLGAQGATICVRSRHLTLSVCLVLSTQFSSFWLRSSSILTKYTYIKIQPEAKICRYYVFVKKMFSILYLCECVSQVSHVSWHLTPLRHACHACNTVTRPVTSLQSPLSFLSKLVRLGSFISLIQVFVVIWTRMNEWNHEGPKWPIKKIWNVRKKTKTTQTLKFPINMWEGITKYICQFKWPQVRILLCLLCLAYGPLNRWVEVFPR